MPATVKPIHDLSERGENKATTAPSTTGSSDGLESPAYESRIAITKPDESPPAPTLAEGIKKKLAHALVSAVPQQPGFDIHDLNKGGVFGFVLAATYLALYVSVLLAFAVTGTQTEYFKKFLALDYSPTSVCDPLPVSVTGKFEGDLYGSWNTKPSFFQNSSLYVLTFTGSAVKLNEYQASMRKFSERLKAIGQRTAKKDLSYSLIAWAAFNVNDAASRMSFYTTAKADTIFSNLAVASVAISSRKGVCQKTGLVGSYDRSSSLYSITVPKDAVPVPTPTNAPNSPVPTPVPSPGYIVDSYYTDSPTKCSSDATLHVRSLQVPGECIKETDWRTGAITGSYRMIITSATTSVTTTHSTDNCMPPPTPAPTIVPTFQPSLLPTSAPPAYYYVSSLYSTSDCTGPRRQVDTVYLPGVCRQDTDSTTGQPTGTSYQFVASGTPSLVWTSYTDAACNTLNGNQDYGPFDGLTCTATGGGTFLKKSVMTLTEFSQLPNLSITSFYGSTTDCEKNTPYELQVTSSSVCYAATTGSYTQSCLDSTYNYVFYSDSSCTTQTSTASYPRPKGCQSSSSGNNFYKQSCSTNSAVQPSATPAPSPAPTSTPNSPYSASSSETTYLGACIDNCPTPPCTGPRYYMKKISYQPLSAILPPNVEYFASYTSLQSCLSGVATSFSWQNLKCFPTTMNDEQAYLTASCQDDLLQYQIYSDAVCSTPFRSVSSYARDIPFNCSRQTSQKYDSNNEYIVGSDYPSPIGSQRAFGNDFCSSTSRPLGGGPPTMAPTALTDYTQAESCPDQFQIFPSEGGDSFMGIAGRQDGSAPFTMGFDIRAVTISLAVNLGIIEYSDLLLVKTVPDPYGGAAVYEYYIDTFYLGMPPIVCLQGYKAPGICFYSISDELFYPVLTTTTSIPASQEVFESMPLPTACTCPSAANKPECSLSSTSSGDGFTDAIAKGLQLSFFFGNKPSILDRSSSAAALAVRMRDMMLADPVAGDDKVREKLTKAPYIAVLFSLFKMPADQYKYWLKGQIPFGTTGNYNAFTAAFDAIGQTDISAATFILKPSGSQKQINDNYLELSRFSKPGTTNTACLNSIYQAEALAELSAAPPVAVTEKYLQVCDYVCVLCLLFSPVLIFSLSLLQCHATLSAAASVAVGSANGNASLAASLFLTLVSSLLILYLNSRAKSVEEKILPPATKKAMQEQQLVETVADLQRRIDEIRGTEGQDK